MFTVDYRADVRRRLIEMGRADTRIESAAAVGGSAPVEADRWSDVDLAFGLARGATVESVIDDWTRRLNDEFGAVSLFDVSFRSSLYRVFLLPGSLQVDLSFTPGADFGALGPRFSLVFGTALERERSPAASPRHLFGLGVHHAVRARFCIERGRVWQAEHWISGVRDQALMLACAQEGLEPELGRGFDALPSDVRAAAAEALVRSVDHAELERALRQAVRLLLHDASAAHEDAPRIRHMLEELTLPA